MPNLEKRWLPPEMKRRQLKEELEDLEAEKTEALDAQALSEAGQEGREFEQNISPELQATKDFAEKHPESLDEIYKWYCSAMVRRNRKPLEAERFFRHFFDNDSFDDGSMETEPLYMYGDLGNGFLLGHNKHGIFIPTHFAPKTLRTGYELIRDLGSSTETPAVMAITDDLVETITKLPEWKKVDTKFAAYFGSELVDKTIVYNQNPDVKRLMASLLSDYLNETKQFSN